MRIPSQRQGVKETIKGTGIFVGKSVQKDEMEENAKAQKALAGHRKYKLQRY